MSLLVIRPPYVPDDLLQTCRDLCQITTYRKGAFQEDLAPVWTDCLTSIAFIFNKCAKWRLDWIAHMPRILVLEHQCTVQTGMTAGDVVFFANRQGLIRHAGVFVSHDQIFHCSQGTRGGAIECISAMFAKRSLKSQLPIYYKIDNVYSLLDQIDPRIANGAINAGPFQKNYKLAKKITQFYIANRHKFRYLLLHITESVKPLHKFHWIDYIKNHTALAQSETDPVMMDCSLTPPNQPTPPLSDVPPLVLDPTLVTPPPSDAPENGRKRKVSFSEPKETAPPTLEGIWILTKASENLHYASLLEDGRSVYAKSSVEVP
jgi:hypothetical protein